MFTKIDKKILLISAVLLIIFLIVGFFIYKNLIESSATNDEKGDVIETQDQQKIEEAPQNSNLQNNSPEITIPEGGIKTDNGNTGAGLSICSDRCGDGVCQKSDSECKVDSLNCVCQETKEECPNDCK
ncbi:MAG: hypothetical protein AAB352_02660 [Patescibacteria group bacterium]